MLASWFSVNVAGAYTASKPNRSFETNKEREVANKVLHVGVRTLAYESESLREHQIIHGVDSTMPCQRVFQASSLL